MSQSLVYKHSFLHSHSKVSIFHSTTHKKKKIICEASPLPSPHPVTPIAVKIIFIEVVAIVLSTGKKRRNDNFMLYGVKSVQLVDPNLRNAGLDCSQLRRLIQVRHIIVIPQVFIS